MGYRSQVVLAVSKELMPHFLSVMAKCPKARELVFGHNDELDQDYEGEGHFFVRWDGIKWYESYPEVAKIEQFIADPSDFGFEGEAGEHFKFVRIGEEMDDNSSEGWGFDDIYISRSLQF